MPSLLEVEQFFSEAAEHTWAADMEKSTIAELPGSKVLRYERDGLLYADMYWVSGNMGFGQIIIYEGEDILWTMGFYGEYPKHVIPFLKQALLAQYRTRQCNGGRGPAKYRLPGDKLDPFEYRNTVEGGRNLLNFRGRESVSFWLTGEVLGWHRYWGFATEKLRWQ